MGFLNKEVELIISRKKQNNTNNETIEIKSFNGYDAIREETDFENTAMRHTPVEQPTKPKTQVSIGL